MVLIYVIVGIVVLAVFVSYTAYRMLALIKEMDNLEYEEVSIIAKDGKKLFARYYHVKAGAPIQIQMHGSHGNQPCFFLFIKNGRIIGAYVGLRRHISGGYRSK